MSVDHLDPDNRQKWRDRTIARGFCTGPLDRAPAPGDVGLDYKAACATCGKRVKVTAAGRYSHHKKGRTP